MTVDDILDLYYGLIKILDNDDSYVLYDDYDNTRDDITDYLHETVQGLDVENDMLVIYI